MVGFGGLDDVRFRGVVTPGDKLVLMVKMIKNRRGRMIVAAFQGVVGETIVLEGRYGGSQFPWKRSRVCSRRTEFGIASGCHHSCEPPSQLNIEQPLDFSWWLPTLMMQNWDWAAQLPKWLTKVAALASWTSPVVNRHPRQ